MKKNLFYLFVILCTITACSKEDKPVSWQDISKTYTGEQLDLGTALIGSVGSVDLEALSDEKANLTLTDVVPGEHIVSLSATLQRGGGESSIPGDFILWGATTTPTCELSINGYVLNGILKLDIVRKITSQAAGNWNMGIDNGVADLLIQVKGSPMDDLINSLGPVVGKMLTSKVESVSVSFGEDGRIAIRYKTPGAGEVVLPPTGFEAVLQSFLTWYEKDGVVYLAVRKDIVDIIAAVAPKLSEIDITPYLALLELSGSYYVLPLHTDVQDGHIRFYITKELIVKAWPLVKTFIPSDSTIAPFLPLIENVLTTAETMQLGLGFNR